VSKLKKYEVVVFRSFLKAGIRFPLHKTIVAILKWFNIYLHQLTPNIIERLGIFIWALQSQGVELDDETFCKVFSQIHELYF
jgi:Na+-translocating ferredoxin:NAD+ oxidoreductase RnfE subunit